MESLSYLQHYYLYLSKGELALLQELIYSTNFRKYAKWAFAHYSFVLNANKQITPHCTVVELEKLVGMHNAYLMHIKKPSVLDRLLNTSLLYVWGVETKYGGLERFWRVVAIAALYLHLVAFKMGSFGQ